MRTVCLLGFGLAFTVLAACSDDDDGLGGEGGNAGSANRGGGAAPLGGSGDGGLSVAGGGSGNAGAGGDGGRAGNGGSGQVGVGVPDDGGSSGDGGGVPGGMVHRPALPSGLLAHAAAGCVIAADSSVKCWRTLPLFVPDTLVGLAGPGEYDAVYVERRGNPGPFRCALLHAGGYACDTLGSWRAPASGKSYAQLSFGTEQSCGLSASGAVECWNEAGTAAAPEGVFVQLDAIYDKLCGLRSDGSGECWVGESPGVVFPRGERLTQFSAGVPFNCGINQDSRVVCWGVLGDAVPPGGKALQVQVGADHACALMEDGHVECFSHTPANQFATFERPPAERRFLEISATDRTTCGITVDNEVWCWGYYLPFARVEDRDGQPISARSR